MVFTFKSSAKRHPFIAFFLSLGSLALIHGIVIWGHESVNYSQPNNTILYALDQGIENIELQWAKFFGVQSELEYHMYHVKERTEELEYVLHLETADAYVPMLTTEIQSELNLSELALQRLVDAGGQTPLAVKTIAVELDSEIIEARRLIEVAVEELQVENESIDQLLVQLDLVHDSLQQTLVALNIEEADETIIETRIEYVPIQATVFPPDSSASSAASVSCVQQGGTCRVQEDCCTTGDGFNGVQLTCTFDPEQSGQRALRCLP